MFASTRALGKLHFQLFKAFSPTSTAHVGRLKGFHSHPHTLISLSNCRAWHPFNGTIPIFHLRRTANTHTHTHNSVCHLLLATHKTFIVSRAACTSCLYATWHSTSCKWRMANDSFFATNPANACHSQETIHKFYFLFCAPAYCHGANQSKLRLSEFTPSGVLVLPRAFLGASLCARLAVCARCEMSRYGINGACFTPFPIDLSSSLRLHFIYIIIPCSLFVGWGIFTRGLAFIPALSLHCCHTSAFIATAGTEHTCNINRLIYVLFCPYWMPFSFPWFIWY